MLKAPRDLVIVDPIYSDKAEGSSVIYVQERDQKTRGDLRGIVIAIGPDCPHELKAGDKVLIRRYDHGAPEGVPVEYNGKEYLSLKPEWVEAVEV